MKIIYAGKVIGDDSLMRDIGSGFLPSGQVQVQWLQRLRAADAVPVARGNRQRNVRLRLTFTPSGGALALLTDFFDALPDEGQLQWEENGFIRATAAVLQDYQPADRKGAAGVVDVTFAIARPVTVADGDWSVPDDGAPPPVPQFDWWVDDAGGRLTDDAGASFYFVNED